MGWRQGLTVLALVGSALGTGGTAYAIALPAASDPPASAGTVTLVRGVDPATTDANFTVNFQGRISDHGWSYVGTLSGTGTTWGYSGGVTQPPYLSMTSADGSVSGWCAGDSETGGLVAAGTLDIEFRCVLSRDGGTPWETALDATTQQVASATSQSSWSGRYVGASVTAPEVAADGSPSSTYGEVQLGSQENGDAIAYGPLRFSGQIAIGSTLYRGDLVSATSAFVASSVIPPLPVSGTSNGVTVTGTCTGTPNETASNVAPTYSFTCSLAAGTAPAVTVTLIGVFPVSANACSFRDCWSDEAGWFGAV